MVKDTAINFCFSYDLLKTKQKDTCFVFLRSGHKLSKEMHKEMLINQVNSKIS